MAQMLMLSTRAQSLMDDAEKVDAIGKDLEIDTDFESGFCVLERCPKG